MQHNDAFINDLEAMQKDFASLTNKMIKDAKRHQKVIHLTDKQQYKSYETLKKQYSEIEVLNEEIEHTQREVVFTLGAVCESRSKETGSHVKRVAEYSRILATHYGMSEDEIELLTTVSPMHDVGKVAIPDNILGKPDKFNDNEWKIMKEHAQIGYDMLKHSSRPVLKAASIVALEHHEKWNGTGYPRGLSGEDIHIYDV